MGCLLNKIWDKLVGLKEVRIMIAGIDSSGKTTLLYRLKTGKVINAIPTVGNNVEVVKRSNITLVLWDTGGASKIKELIETAYTGFNGLIFVIDSSDTNEGRFNDAKTHLMNLLKNGKWGSGPLLVLANKQDIKTAMTPKEIEDKLELKTIKEDYFIQGTSVLDGTGIQEGISWFVDALAQDCNNK